MHALIHRYGCGKPAFLWTPERAPEKADPVSSDTLAHLDGRPLTSGRLPLCDSCGGSLGLRDLDADFFEPYQHGARAGAPPLENT